MTTEGANIASIPMQFTRLAPDSRSSWERNQIEARNTELHAGASPYDIELKKFAAISPSRPTDLTVVSGTKRVSSEVQLTIRVRLVNYRGEAL